MILWYQIDVARKMINQFSIVSIVQTNNSLKFRFIQREPVIKENSVYGRESNIKD